MISPRSVCTFLPQLITQGKWKPRGIDLMHSPTFSRRSSRRSRGSTRRCTLSHRVQHWPPPTSSGQSGRPPLRRPRTRCGGSRWTDRTILINSNILDWGNVNWIVPFSTLFILLHVTCFMTLLTKQNRSRGTLGRCSNKTTVEEIYVQILPLVDWEWTLKKNSLFLNWLNLDTT